MPTSHPYGIQLDLLDYEMAYLDHVRLPYGEPQRRALVSGGGELCMAVSQVSSVVDLHLVPHPRMLGA